MFVSVVTILTDYVGVGGTFILTTSARGARSTKLICN